MSDPEHLNALPGLRELRRLRKNVNGYFGETIDVAATLSDCVAAASKYGWLIEELCASPTPGLLALTRKAGDGSSHPRPGLRRPRVYISTGIHGDEPAGPLAVRQLLEENRWPPNLDLWLCPCLNPAGFARNRRENPEGLDLNRQYLNPKTPETMAHIAWLERQPSFDLCLCLHEDWESDGFYIYELNPDNQPSLAPAMLESLARLCPIDRSELIEGRPAQNGIIRPSIDPRTRPQWPESFFLVTYKTRHSYTLEAPSDFPLDARVASLVSAVNTAADRIAASGHDH